MKLGLGFSPLSQQTGVTPAKIGGTVAASSAVPAVDRVEVGNNSDGAQMAKLAVAGIGSLALGIPCSYAGMAGGAIVGGLLGGALGPVTHAFSSSGLLQGLGSAWDGAGFYGHYGMVLGGATALVGAVATSGLAGQAIGHLLGVPKSSESPKDINWENWATIGAGTVLLTSGISAGVVGGFALASGAAAAGTILNGVIQHGFTAAALSGAGSSALLAGAIGAPLAGAVGAKGGAALTKILARKLIDPTTSVFQGSSQAIAKSSPTPETGPAAPTARVFVTDSKARQVAKRVGQEVLQHPITGVVLDIAGFCKKHPAWAVVQAASLGLGVASAFMPGIIDTLMPIGVGLASLNAVNAIGRGIIQPDLSEADAAQVGVSRAELADRQMKCFTQHFFGATFVGFGTFMATAGFTPYLGLAALGMYIDSCAVNNESILRDTFQKVQVLDGKVA